MQSMFNNVSFARFDLGRHVLGELMSCPPGEIPMNNNGRVSCVKYSAPSGMFMPVGPTKSIAYGMGQGSEPYLTQAERDALLIRLQSAKSRIAPLQKLMDWSANNDPELRRFLTTDAPTFWLLSYASIPVQADAEAVYSRLADSSPENWWRPSEEEYSAINQYVDAFEGMWKIYQLHNAMAYIPAAGTVPPPVLTLQVPDKGINPENIVLGGVVAIGLALLVSAIL
jgi:hypothetical protein